jgi:DNA mismatch repair protein MutS
LHIWRFCGIIAGRNSTIHPTLKLVGGRHAVVEQQHLSRGERGKRFVPNDLYLNSSTTQFWCLTGPNMGGKSTVLAASRADRDHGADGLVCAGAARQTGDCDRVFTRMGPATIWRRGRSTFMVEMTETAAILHTASPRSLILLDEVGRGTATYDGLAIAWAAIEYLHSRTRAKTLFATHYFELTDLAEQLSDVKNYHVSVKETKTGIVVSAKSGAGGGGPELWNRSSETGRLAGGSCPPGARGARRTREPRESNEHAARGDSPLRAAQLTIFTPLSQPVLEKLRDVDLNHLTPLEALNLLAELKKQIQ